MDSQEGGASHRENESPIYEHQVMGMASPKRAACVVCAVCALREFEQRARVLCSTQADSGARSVSS